MGDREKVKAMFLFTEKVKMEGMQRIKEILVKTNGGRGVNVPFETQVQDSYMSDRLFL